EQSGYIREPPPEVLLPMSSTTTTDATVSLARTVIDELCLGYKRDFAVRFWDGSTWEAETGPAPRFTLALKHPGALKRMCQLFNRVALPEAYLFDDFDVEGDIFAFIGWLKHLISTRRSRGLRSLLRVFLGVMRMPGGGPPRPTRKQGTAKGSGHSKEADRE